MISRHLRRHEAARGAGGAIGIIVRMVQSRAGFLDVRAGIRTLPCFEQRSESHEQLGDGEEQNRRTPERSR